MPSDRFVIGVFQVTSARMIQARIDTVPLHIAVGTAEPIAALVAVELPAIPCHDLMLADWREAAEIIVGELSILLAVPPARRSCSWPPFRS